MLDTQVFSKLRYWIYRFSLKYGVGYTGFLQNTVLDIQVGFLQNTVLDIQVLRRFCIGKAYLFIFLFLCSILWNINDASIVNLESGITNRIRKWSTLVETVSGLHAGAGLTNDNNSPPPPWVMDNWKMVTYICSLLYIPTI